MASPALAPRRLVFHRCRHVEIEPFALPAPAAGEVVVATARSLMSTGTETIVYNRNFDAGTHWDNWIKYPFHPGYAAVGTVLAVGAGVTALRPGDRVAHRSGHASHAVLKATACHPIPDEVAFDDAVWFPLAKIAGVGVRAAGLTLGDTVAVIGAGPIGQMTLRWALTNGAQKVFTIDLTEPRLQMAARAGAVPILAAADQAVAAIRGALDGGRPRVVIDSTGNAQVLHAALGLAADFGTIVLIGDTGSPGGQTLTSDVITRGLRLVGAHDTHNTPAWNDAVAAACFFAQVRQNRFPMAGLNTHHFPPEACAEAYTLASEDRQRTMGILFDWNYA